MANLSIWVRGATKESKDRMVSLAKRDLAERLESSEDYIGVVSVTPVTWVDATLGYPQPGKKVVPGYVPGFQVILSFSERKYEYHASFNRVVFVPQGKGQQPLPAEIM